MPTISTLQHCHLHILLIVFSNLLITVFTQLFLVFNLHILIISLSSFSLIFAHELIDFISIDLLLLLLIAHEFVSGVDLHICVVFFFFFLEVSCFLLADLSTAAVVLMLFSITSFLGNESIENNFHVINFKLAWFLHKTRKSLDIWSISVMLHKFTFVGMTLEFWYLAQEFSTTTFKFIGLTQWWIS